MTSLMDFDAVRSEVSRLSEALSLPPHKITSRLWREHAQGEGLASAEKRHLQKAKHSFPREDAPLDIVPKGHHVSGVSTLVDEHGNVKIQWIKTAFGKMSREELLAKLVDAIEVAPLPPSASVQTPQEAQDFLAVYPLGDLHLGMYAAAKQAGTDWNLQKGVKIAQQAIDDLTLYGEPAERALLINLGDFFHTSGPAGTTVKGTPQDTDGTYEQCVEAGLSLKIYMVRRLLQVHEHVTVWSKIGNHDGIAALMIQIALREHFRDDPRVTIEVSSQAISHMAFGRNMISSTHGDSRGAKKPEDMVITMANDEPEIWGGAWNRYAYLGHVHHKVVKEVTGGVVEWFRTTTPGDAWHAGALYRAGRDMCRILLHKEDGEVARRVCSVGRLRRTHGEL